MYAELNLKKRKREDRSPEAQGKPAEDIILDEGEIPVGSVSGIAGTSQLRQCQNELSLPVCACSCLWEANYYLPVTCHAKIQLCWCSFVGSFHALG